jgi:hypothetical protein
MTANPDRPSIPAFYGLEPQWASSDRLFKIYITGDALYGAYVAGQFYDAEIAANALSVLYFVLHRRVQRAVRRRHELERVYDGLVGTPTELLARDERNFCIERTRLFGVTVRRRRSWWTPDNRGSLHLELADGSKRRFLFVEKQDPDRIAAMLECFWPTLEVL